MVLPLVSEHLVMVLPVVMVLPLVSEQYSQPVLAVRCVTVMYTVYNVHYSVYTV